MATINIVQAKFLGNAEGKPAITRGGPESPDIKETASQSYAAGAPVYYDSNGTIAVATASSNLVGQLAGFALEPATGTTGAAVRYRVVQPGDRYVVNLAGTSTTTTNLNQVGDLINFDISSGKLVGNLDSAVDTNVAAIVEELYTAANGYGEATDAAGDTNGRLVVRFIATKGLQG
jgi:hypothetical protein